MDKQIRLSPDLAAKIEREAKARGISMSQLVSEWLERILAQSRADDPLFADDAVFRDQGPDDAADNHDDYLYGEAS